MRRGLSPHGLFALQQTAHCPDELARNLPTLALDLDAATMAELERLTEPVKEAIGRNYRYVVCGVADAVKRASVRQPDQAHGIESYKGFTLQPENGAIALLRR